MVSVVQGTGLLAAGRGLLAVRFVVRLPIRLTIRLAIRLAVRLALEPPVVDLATLFEVI